MKAKIFGIVTTFFLFAIACEKEQMLQIESKNDSTPALKNATVDVEFLVISNSDKLPAKFEDAILRIDGHVKNTLRQVGIAIVESDDPDFATNAEKIQGISFVVPNLTMQFLDPNETMIMMEDYGNPPFSGDDDFFFDLQWGHDAIDAPEAWDLGFRGEGVRVGILDGGFDLDHPDLSPNINMGLSYDLTGEGLQYSIPNAFSHGSHVAGTIAAADNGFGTIGVAPEAELVLIKVLSDNGSGSLGDVLEGIIYSAIVGCDVINMSLGTTLYRSGDIFAGYTAKDVAGLVSAYIRVIAFANQQGVTVMTSAGNDAIDFDHTADLIHIPSDIANTISISATAPVGWAVDPTTNLDVFTSYSNYGQSAIDFAAPGGDFQYYSVDPDAICTVGGVIQYCYVFDYVFSTGNEVWYWAAGTSMATPHATGVAALIIGKNGGSMQPKQVRMKMIKSADDLGKPGNDDFFGMGRVNAMKAVMN